MRLLLSIEENAVLFCFCCCHFATTQLGASGKDAFVVTGYSNCQCVAGKKGGLEMHAKSKAHCLWSSLENKKVQCGCYALSII